MSSQYEIEHSIKPQAKPRGRRPDMSSFDALLDQVSTSGARTSASAIFSAQEHHNPHATPTPVDMAALYRLVQDQMASLASTAPSTENRILLESLMAELDASIADPPTEVCGLGQDFLDGLERVDRGRVGVEETCPICAEKHRDDPYCLVVELPCHKSHRFDLECVAPWIQSKGSCPLCRTDFTKKKEVVRVEDSEEEDDDPAGMYA
ncbi:putative RING finger protein [Ceratocystis platani]|uniref:Putative RING finger protein n=1 Tax=Ceratocystis fimbriata f. sp. platani TaxID=88771 RepID=A0A0F8B445_CERFI|nr:putative RING finger protein [Ceratocystis platani]